MPLTTLELVATSVKGSNVHIVPCDRWLQGLLVKNGPATARAPHHTYGVGNYAWKELRVDRLAFELTAENPHLVCDWAIVDVVASVVAGPDQIVAMAP